VVGGKGRNLFGQTKTRPLLHKIELRELDSGGSGRSYCECVTNQLLLGAGKLPDWLRKKKNGMHALDTYEDNLCLFRCIDVST